MPLFTAELNRLADSIGADPLTVYVHTAAPTDADITSGRVTTGGGPYENGKAVVANQISNAADGDIMITVELDYGEAAANVGTLSHWSAVRGNAGVAWGTLRQTVIERGDTFTINPNTLKLNGS